MKLRVKAHIAGAIAGWCIYREDTEQVVEGPFPNKTRTEVRRIWGEYEDKMELAIGWGLKLDSGKFKQTGNTEGS